jgi:hypothetical protein
MFTNILISLPFPVKLVPCNICGAAQVPDIIFSTIQPLAEIETIGQGCVLHAIVTRSRKKCTGEISAKIISDYLPFMEYELHRQLLLKLKVFYLLFSILSHSVYLKASNKKLKGMNMLYGLRVQISIGKLMITSI